MKKIKKLILISVIILALYIVKTLLGGLIIGGVFFPPISHEGVEKRFQQHKEYILTVTDYFEKSEYRNIYINLSMKSNEFSVGGERVIIEDADIVKAIAYLKRNGCSVIIRDEETIQFQMWANLDSGRGIAYSINGEKPVIEFLTKLEPLSENNWYYYEED